MRKKWLLSPRQPELARQLAANLGVHEVVSELLVHRGVSTVEGAKRFLSRRLADLHDPTLHPGVCEAADRLFAAAQSGKMICVYGDYDVDGMCAAAILLECLRLGGVTARLYVPSRIDEGYGLHRAALESLRAEGIEVVITVDCGITSVAEAERARELGIELIISDHHELGPELPAATLVHPRLPGSEYPFGELCGAGVAFKIAWELARRFSGSTKTTEVFQKFLLDATSLAAIATICDIVPIADENRVFVHHGLLALQKAPLLGLRCLMEQAGIGKQGPVDTGDVAFTLGPRLNACGRLGQARLGVELLRTRDEARARELARYLEDENRVRQTLERRIFQEAKALAEEQYDWSQGGPAAIVLASTQWHPGVIGIVASKMVERFHRPCILIAMGENEGTGSGRSIAGLHLHQALEHCRELLRGCGGHAMAAGLRIAAANLDSFREAFCAKVEAQLRDQDLFPVMRVDIEVPLGTLSPNLLRALDLLAPFGLRNPTPLFLATNLQLVGEPRKMGNGERHLSFHVTQGGRRMRAVAFQQADRVEELVADGGRVCLVFNPRLSEYRGFPEVELIVRDFRPGSQVTEQAPECSVM